MADLEEMLKALPASGNESEGSCASFDSDSDDDAPSQQSQSRETLKGLCLSDDEDDNDRSPRHVSSQHTAKSNSQKGTEGLDDDALFGDALFDEESDVDMSDSEGSDDGDGLGDTSHCPATSLSSRLFGLPQVANFHRSDWKRVSSHIGHVYQRWHSIMKERSQLETAFLILELDIHKPIATLMEERQQHYHLIMVALSVIGMKLKQISCYDTPNVLEPNATNENLIIRLEMLAFEAWQVVHYVYASHEAVTKGPQEIELDAEKALQDAHDGEHDGNQYRKKGKNSKKKKKQDDKEYRTLNNSGRRIRVSHFQGIQDEPWELAMGGNFQLSTMPFHGITDRYRVARAARATAIQLNLKRSDDGFDVLEQRYVTYKGKRYPTRTWRRWQPIAMQVDCPDDLAAAERDLQFIEEDVELEQGDEEEDLEHVVSNITENLEKENEPYQYHSDSDTASVASSSVTSVASSASQTSRRSRRSRKSKKAKKTPPKKKKVHLSAQGSQTSKTFETLLYMACRRDVENGELWDLVMNPVTRRRVIAYLQACIDPHFERVKPSARYYSFQNGIFDFEKIWFYTYDDPDIPQGIVAVKYLPLVFPWEELRQARGPNWATGIKTPIMDALLRSQMPNLSKQEQDRSIQIIHAMLGRLHTPNTKYDYFQVVPFLLSAPGCNVELLRESILVFFDPKYVASISNVCDKTFGLMPFARDVVLWAGIGVDRRNGMEQSAYQSIATGEPTSFPCKFKKPVTKIAPHGFQEGHEPPRYYNNSNSVGRRQFVIPHNVKLCRELRSKLTWSALMKELAALLMKRACAYFALVNSCAGNDIWGSVTRKDPANPGKTYKVPILTSHFLKANAHMKEYSSPLSSALGAPDSGLFVLGLDCTHSKRQEVISKFSLRMPFKRFREVVEEFWQRDKDNSGVGLMGTGKKRSRFPWIEKAYGTVFLEHGLQLVQPSPQDNWTYPIDVDIDDYGAWVEGVTEASILSEDEKVDLDSMLDEAYKEGHESLTLSVPDSEELWDKQQRLKPMESDTGNTSASRKRSTAKIQTMNGNEGPKIPLAPPREEWCFPKNLHGMLDLTHSDPNLNVDSAEHKLSELYNVAVTTHPIATQQPGKDLEAMYQWGLDLLDLPSHCGYSKQDILFHSNYLLYVLETLAFILNHPDASPNPLKQPNSYMTGVSNASAIRIVSAAVHSVTLMMTSQQSMELALHGHAENIPIDKLRRKRKLMLTYQPSNKDAALLEHVIAFCRRNDFCRRGETVLRQRLTAPRGPKQTRYPTRYWEPIGTLEEVVMMSCSNFANAQMWNLMLTCSKNISTILSEHQDTISSTIPEKNVGRRYFAFANGIYDVDDDMFYDWENPAFPPNIVACNYFPEEMNWEELKDKPWRDIKIESWDTILQHQIRHLCDDDEQDMRDVSDVIDALCGRIFFPITRTTVLRVILFALGKAGTGKSTFVNYLMSFFPEDRRAYISNFEEPRFFYSRFIGMQIAGMTEVRGVTSVEASHFIAVADAALKEADVKNGSPQPVKLQTPFVVSGNLPPNCVRENETLRKKTATIPFENPVAKDSVDPNLLVYLEQARAPFIVRTRRANREFESTFAGCTNIWAPMEVKDPLDPSKTVTRALMPAPLQRALQKLLTYNNMLSQALSTNESPLYLASKHFMDMEEEDRKAIYLNNKLYMPMEDFRMNVEHIALTRNLQSNGFKWSRCKDILEEYGLIQFEEANVTYGGIRYPEKKQWIAGIIPKSMVQESTKQTLENLRHSKTSIAQQRSSESGNDVDMEANNEETGLDRNASSNSIDRSLSASSQHSLTSTSAMSQVPNQEELTAFLNEAVDDNDSTSDDSNTVHHGLQLRRKRQVQEITNFASSEDVETSREVDASSQASSHGSHRGSHASSSLNPEDDDF